MVTLTIEAEAAGADSKEGKTDAAGTAGVSGPKTMTCTDDRSCLLQAASERKVEWLQGLLPESQGHNLALTVLHVQYFNGFKEFCLKVKARIWP